MAFSKLLGRDAQEVTPQHAGAAFAEEAKRIALEQNIDLSEAWQRAKKLHPECHARLCEGAQPTVSLANSATIPPAPLGKELYLPMFKLPPTTTDDEFAAAWRGNGGRVQPLNAPNVLMALVTFTAKTKKVSVTAARDIVLEKFKTLAAAAGEAAV
jgi:hypothetical protein